MSANKEVKKELKVGQIWKSRSGLICLIRENSDNVSFQFPFVSENVLDSNDCCVVDSKGLFWASGGNHPDDLIELVQDFQEIPEESGDNPEKPKVKQGHPHAELMLQYAKDSLTNPEAWKEWEIESGKGAWCNLDSHPCWIPENNYRKKQQYFIINGIAVKAGLKEEPEEGDLVYKPSLFDKEEYMVFYWVSSFEYFHSIFQKGMLFNNSEDAVAMTRALLSFKKD